MNDLLALATSKTVIYNSLARAMNYPDASLASALAAGAMAKDLGEVLSEEVGPLLKGLSVYNGSDAEALLLELEKDDTWMCFASKPRIAYLFGSVYSEGRLYQESTFEIARLYHEAGLKLEESFRLPPDHIAVELECMAYLSFNEVEAIKAGNRENEEYARELQGKLMEKYLAPLALSLGPRMAEQAKTVFYRTIGRLLLMMVEA